MTENADPLELVRAANPVPTPMLDGRDARRAEELLTRLRAGGGTAAALSTLIDGGRRGRRRRVLVAGLAAAALIAGTGVAVADDVPPFGSIAAFAGIGTADRTQAPQDLIDPALIQRANANLARAGAIAAPIGALLPDTARLLTQLSSGTRIYVIGTTTNKLCVITESTQGNGVGCGDPDSQTQPTTVESQDFAANGPDATPPITFGVARDDVTAVSFMADGSEQTVPVVDNVWFYVGDCSALESLTVRYADGTTETITH